jgi:hypothetical protein
MTSDFSAETLNTRKTWDDIFQVLRVNNCHEDYDILRSYPEN